MTTQFEKGGVVRVAESPAEEVRFRYDGWRQVRQDDAETEREGLERKVREAAVAVGDDSVAEDDLSDQSDEDLREYVAAFENEGGSTAPNS